MKMDMADSRAGRRRLGSSIVKARLRNNINRYYSTIPDIEDVEEEVADNDDLIHGGNNNANLTGHSNDRPSNARQPNDNNTTCDITDYYFLGNVHKHRGMKPKVHPSNSDQPVRQQPVKQSNELFSNPTSARRLTSNIISDESETLQSDTSCNLVLLDEIKSRLSLPIETPIPYSAISKLMKKFSINASSEINQTILQQIMQTSRTHRRKFLQELGFGQLSTYVKSNVLGTGTYSTVYKGCSRLTKSTVALKEIRLERDEGVPFTAIREASLLKALKHFNIITLHDIIYTGKTLTLVFEYVDCDLSHYMDKCDHKIDIDNVRLFLFQLLRGLKYCHERMVLHRDLKPQNILISSNGDLKLADFGLARAKSVPTKTFTDEVVTLWYRPPDVLLGNIDYGTSIDMWGVGCIFCEMAVGFTLFTGTSPKKQIESIFEIIGTPGEDDWPSIHSDLRSCSLEHISQSTGRDLSTIAPRLDPNGVGLLKSFLQCNPSKRISSTAAIKHPYFESLPKAIYGLSDSESIFSIPGVKLNSEQTSSNNTQSTSNDAGM